MGDQKWVEVLAPVRLPAAFGLGRDLRVTAHPGDEAEGENAQGDLGHDRGGRLDRGAECLVDRGHQRGDCAAGDCDHGEGGNGEGEEPKWTADKDGFVELVFVIGDGTVSARQVETGIQSDTHIEIVVGLEEGEAIVVGNYRAISRDLEDGSEVVVADDPAGSGGGESG